MSIFGTILSKVFGTHHQDAATSQPTTTTTNTTTPNASTESAPPTAPATPAPPPGTAPAPSGASPTVDVAAVLDGMEDHAGQKLDWRHSIVDLMKLLGMDSSLTARKELAHELNFTGDTGDSASMNIWLHKQVMAKFGENGGKLPPDLAH